MPPQTAAQRAWYERHRAQILETRKRYYEENHDAVREQQNARMDASLDARKRRTRDNRAYYLANQELLRQRARARHAEAPRH